MSNFNIGDRVKLLEFEDSPEEVGTIIEIEDNGMLVVEVDDDYCGWGDDGIRETEINEYIEII